ncbi:hypothetical protein [Yersinia intermedia]|uniref:hypothetical protein n=1 Tax=Yersinia intermedia TaxID=631 RepID=UPI0005E72436|nr:hypothetical protein [Yersinia intermedia]EKN6014608.1 hypothetical protein [Yersinia enterocolitica]CNK14408.1 Uncharacterised protein [Yersinia frederiksenii]EKN6041962.1 hypothetical protein [Yersinia enterocolitica]MCB5315718.1 hypothetical protein [Yersinia intermedia]MCB5329592.1 hypothetical protein [Yersinia intermedia]
MGYKYKATMYYSDDETDRFLREKAAKPNGKKSASHYLYSLVTRERENAASVELNQEEVGVVRIYPEYTRLRRIEVSGLISFTALPAFSLESKATQKRLDHKDLMKEIDGKIHLDITSKFNNHNNDFNHNGSFLVVIKTDVTCYYNRTVSGAGYCEGNFLANCTILHITRSEWERWGGKYDFERIKYIKFRDLSNPRARKSMGLCQLAEIAPLDTAGAFFIPVRTTAKAFPSDKFLAPLIIGVDITFNKDRVRLKPMNDTQKKRHFG